MGDVAAAGHEPCIRVVDDHPCRKAIVDGSRGADPAIVVTHRESHVVDAWRRECVGGRHSSRTAGFGHRSVLDNRVELPLCRVQIGSPRVGERAIKYDWYTYRVDRTTWRAGDGDGRVDVVDVDGSRVLGEAAVLVDDPAPDGVCAVVGECAACRCSPT